jgi:maltooligosyltrehalose trehalohydrolase
VNNLLQKIGAWYTPSLSEFIVWAPLRQQVELVIPSSSPEGRSTASSPDVDQSPAAIYPMEKDQRGYWKVSITAEAGTRYLYRLDGKDRFPDPVSVSQPDGVHSASQLLDRNGILWEDDNWKGLPLSNMIIYELHTGIFSDTHDFEGIIKKLDHLVRLGINAIELMPLAQFPGKRNWGYDGVYPFAIQYSYGGRQGFAKLVNAAHAKGLAVIVDVVYNHLGPEGNHLREFGPYFTEKYHTPWGMALNFDDAWCDGVRNYFLQNVRMWLEELHVDALRLDAVHAIYDNSAQPFLRQLKELALDISRQTGRIKEIIAETDLNDPKFINAPEKGGYGLDGQWNDEFHHALHALLTGEKDEYYADFGTIGHLEKAFRDTYVYNGNYSCHRKKFFGAPTLNPFNQFVVFTQNHDQVGNRARGDRLAATLSFEQLKLAAATLLLSPYIPLLFMGEEYGENNPFLFFTDFSDPDLIEAIRKGRASEFRYANNDFPDPQDEHSFQRCVLCRKEDQGSECVMFNYYRHLIDFRKTRPAMQGVTRDALLVHPSQGNVLAFERKIVNDHLYIWLNFSGEIMTLKNEGEDPLYRIIDSAASDWGGPGTPALHEIASGNAIVLSPYSASVFENKS